MHLVLLLQVDEHDVGVVTLPIEHDVLSVRRHVEGAQRCRVVELRELARLFRREVEQPEIRP
jgi:hypothetical protein